MFKPHTKFKVSTITCNDTTHGVHLWLDG